ncbi:Bax inhibitor 1 [Gracilariopsis chorda]|uniref:Bax inhibitor 1 n=1 Tax=Gracilariopsis chorda TaxID=448386 RepID=A0A2V3IT09_9FLOR|nr:Bax inhibitor 1 [Gracilariopsis chorda]|eukprot:PXF45251.1 Bax inhibitor 1 [Gracilariopsis chorda]
MLHLFPLRSTPSRRPHTPQGSRWDSFPAFPTAFDSLDSSQRLRLARLPKEPCDSMSYASYAYPSDPTSHFRPQPRQNAMDSLMSHVDPVVQKHLRRVYSSLTVALSLATVGAFSTMYMLERGATWLATLSSILVLPSLLLFHFLGPNSPKRTAAFHFFAFIDGCAAGPLLSVVTDIDPRIPAMAFLGGAMVFACCSISAIFARRKSYLFLSSFLFTGLFGLCLVSLLRVFWPRLVPVMPTLYIGLMMFCGFVLYDTQIIIEKAHAGERDHLKHALELFIDFVAIVRHIMVIMANNRQRRDNDDNRRRKSRRN